MNLPNVFVIILNWNRPDDTIECLKSIEKIKASTFKLHAVVVDNASTDDSIKQIQNYRSKLKIIKNKENLGFAGGNNIGINYALKNNADYVVVLNNDTLVDTNLISQLLKTAQSQKFIGAVCPKIYFAPGFEFHTDRYKKSDLGKVIWAVGGSIDWKNVYGTNRGVDEVDTGQFELACEVDFAPGTCVLYSAQALKKTGLFDEQYFLYLEDTDLSIRLTRKGFKIMYTPHAIIWHKVAQSSGIGSDLNDYFITRNRLLFGFKYANLRAKAALIRESIKFLRNGRKWQKVGVQDYYFGNYGKGSWKS